MTEPVIVVVDDDAAFLNFMQEVLTEEGYHAIVLDSSDGVEVAVQRQPDLLILDLRLEQANSGWALLQRVRADTTSRQLPIIVCSADGGFLNDQAELLQRMNCAHIEKPFDVDTLLTMIAGIIMPNTPKRASDS
ncbi:MAG: response regulator [Herpetosiphonaceae bacterium]|nr:response regulator [Herpetosiphonaceae bacterium]